MEMPTGIHIQSGTPGMNVPKSFPVMLEEFKFMIAILAKFIW